jgi:hypothetical protein
MIFSDRVDVEDAVAFKPVLENLTTEDTIITTLHTSFSVVSPPRKSTQGTVLDININIKMKR